jgi:hypothetical protein
MFMISGFRSIAVLLASGMLLAAAGCSTSQLPVSGEVKLDGQPVAGPGIISFYPDPPTEVAGASAEIVDGQYQIPAESGVAPGTYRVEITWPKPTGRKLPSADPGMEMEERVEAIPAKYNKSSELKVQIDSDQTVHNFELKSK